MLTQTDILSKLDNYQLGYYCQFIGLGHPYSYLIDSRLNVFRDDTDNWAIVSEKLGYNPRATAIDLEICYFGNCLINLEQYNKQKINNYTVSPIDRKQFFDTIEGESLKSDAKYWIVRDNKIPLSYNEQDYIEAGIELLKYEPNEIRIEEAARLLIIKYGPFFRATDEELYKSIPNTLKKILVLDEWYHKDFTEIIIPTISKEHLKKNYELNKEHLENMSFETYSALYQESEIRNNKWNATQWEDNRPSSYETWQQLSKVILTRDVSFYKPIMPPNTHWKNWPESGSL